MDAFPSLQIELSERHDALASMRRAFHTRIKGYNLVFVHTVYLIVSYHNVVESSSLVCLFDGMVRARMCSSSIINSRKRTSIGHVNVTFLYSDIGVLLIV
jgi:hypothetical protein